MSIITQYCCEEMRRADKIDHFYNCVTDGYLIFGYEYDDKIKLNFCPACGKKIEGVNHTQDYDPFDNSGTGELGADRKD